MDKRLFDLLCEVLPQANRFSELFIRREALIPGCVTIEGKDLKAVLDSKSFESFLQEDANKMLFNKKIITTKDELLKLFEGFPEEAKEYYEYSISILRRIILSLTNLVPTKIEDRDIKVQESIKRFLFVTTNYLPYWENSIQSSSDCFDQSSDNINPQGSKIFFWVMMTGLISLNIMTITSIHFHNIVYEYFYGPTDKKDENANKLDLVLSFLVNIKANQDNTSLQVNSIKKDTKQLIKDNKNHSKDLKDIKDKQIKIDDKVIRKSETIIQKVENRNRVERRKKLTQKLCAKIIQEKIKLYNKKREDFLKEYNIIKYYREFSVPERNSIRREIQRWERFQKTNGKDGITPPANYTRMTSELEFDVFAEKLELEKYNEWKAFITEKFLTSHNNNL